MRTSLEQHLGSRQVGRVVYGAIIGLALTVAIENARSTSMRVSAESRKNTAGKATPNATAAASSNMCTSWGRVTGCRVLVSAPTTSL